MLLIAYFILVIALLGHGAVWVGLINRLHALLLPRRLLKSSDVPNLILLVGIPLWITWFCVLDPLTPLRLGRVARTNWWLAAYLVLCLLAAVVVLVSWLQRQIRTHSGTLLSNHSTLVDTLDYLDRKPIGSLFAGCLASVPGQQMFTLQINSKTLYLERLEDALSGLSIAHLSDLHFSGRITRRFFEVVVDRANDLDADIVAVTGDIIDKSRCLDWFPETLGRLRSRHGVYFVLGNHDKRIPDTRDLRKRLSDLGLIDLGGRHRTLTVRGRRILLAGNELPWFGPPPDSPPRNRADTEDSPFRLLLAHTPDQIGWARRHGFDLMLAGHTHGGQIRLPIIGPIFAPSLHGIRYSDGVFFEPPTVLHVSRGVSGLNPIRWNCPPELPRLILQRRPETP